MAEGLAGRRLTLAMLVIAYTLNFVDRQIIGILAVPIKSALALSDTQLAMMGGVAFALFYSTVGLPIAWLADRTSRSGVIAVAIAVWSGFTALCGVATGFWSLFLARVGVGVGEAGGVAPSYALIAETFPARERARALSIFAFGSPFGSAIGIFLGGWIATRFDWRVAFFAVGLAGVLFAPVFWWVVKDPPRVGAGSAGRRTTATDATLASSPRVRWADAWPTLVRTPALWILALAAAVTSVAGYGLLFWLPSFFTRSHGLTLLEASRVFGAIVLVGGISGAWAGGWLADRLGAESRRWYGLVPAIAAGLAAPLYALGVLADSLPVTLALFVVAHALGMVWLGPVTAALQHVVPPTMRATASALYLFVLNLIGIGGGTLFFGFVSDELAPRLGSDSLRYAILIGLSFYLLASALFVVAARRLPQAWRE